MSTKLMEELLKDLNQFVIIIIFKDQKMHYIMGDPYFLPESSLDKYQKIGLCIEDIDYLSTSSISYFTYKHSFL